MSNPGEKDPSQPGNERRFGKGLHAQELKDKKDAPPSHVTVMSGVEKFLRDLDGAPIEDVVETQVEEEVDITTLSGDALLEFDMSERIAKLNAEMAELGIDVSPVPVGQLVLVSEGFQIAS